MFFIQDFLNILCINYKNEWLTIKYVLCFAMHDTVHLQWMVKWWDRQTSDYGKPAIVYKSERRAELEEQGFRIHGSSGDQWSDLLGLPMAIRSFKLPNPMYYIAWCTWTEANLCAFIQFHSLTVVSVIFFNANASDATGWCLSKDIYRKFVVC